MKKKERERTIVEASGDGNVTIVHCDLWRNEREPVDCRDWESHTEVGVHIWYDYALLLL